MRDCFRRYYRCIALPFGWGRSVLWFTKLMRPVVKYIRSKLRFRMLPWIEDFLCAQTDGSRPATMRDCHRARLKLDVLFRKLGIKRHPEKGCWRGSRVLEHLCVLLDTERMRVFVKERKVLAMRRLGRDLLLGAQRNRRLVSLEKLRHFCGVAVSRSLAFPMAFFTHAVSTGI
jgi:hypothetical protein